MFTSSEMIVRCEIILTNACIKYYIPFNVIGKIAKLCSNLFPDSKIARGLKLNRQIARRYCIEIIGNFNRK